jgi:hypothetical protein
MAEYDPMEELGFVHDKQLVCSSLGFLQMNNSTRDICKKFIKNGEKLYDLVSRYEDVVSYVLNRDENRSSNLQEKYLLCFPGFPSHQLPRLLLYG